MRNTINLSCFPSSVWTWTVWYITHSFHKTNVILESLFIAKSRLSLFDQLNVNVFFYISFVCHALLFFFFFLRENYPSDIFTKLINFSSIFSFVSIQKCWILFLFLKYLWVRSIVEYLQFLDALIRYFKTKISKKFQSTKINRFSWISVHNYRILQKLF